MRVTFRRLLMAFVLAVFFLGLLFPSATAKAGNSPPLRRLRVPVLMYHYISVPPPGSDAIRLDLSVTPENFTRQMDWLKQKGFTSISPDDLINALQRGTRLPAHPVLITFDDGYIDAYTNAFPILKSFDFKGTFFLITNYVDHGYNAYVSWEQAKEMARAGMSIENHSRQHLDMRNRSRDWLDNEILDSIQDIQDKIGIRPKIFCYPSGLYDSATIQAAKADGVVLAFTTHDGTYMTSDGTYRLPRVRIHGSTTLSEFASLMIWKR